MWNRTPPLNALSFPKIMFRSVVVDTNALSTNTSPGFRLENDACGADPRNVSVALVTLFFSIRASRWPIVRSRLPLSSPVS